MRIKEYFQRKFYDKNTGEEIGRTRVRFEGEKNIILKATVQLEGLVLGKWMPLERYDFAPWENPPVHLQKEHISITHKKRFPCSPEKLIPRALKILSSLTTDEIKELIKKREEVFKKEGK